MLTNVGYCYLWFVYGFLALTASKNGQIDKLKKFCTFCQGMGLKSKSQVPSLGWKMYP